MVLRKPSEYFKKEISSVNNSVQDLVKTPELNTFSDAFESFKNNLSKIEILSEFSETLDNYRVNIERVNHLSEQVGDIQTEIQTLLKKEDLDRAMMSQLLVVEQSIRDVQSKVKGINEKNLTEIRLDVSGLTESVNEFLEIEVPKYKKLVVDSELRSNKRYDELEENVNSTLEGIGEFVDKKYDELTETLQGINEQSLSGIIEDFKTLDKSVLKFKEEEIPKYKGLIVETERKTETKLESFNQKLDETFNELNQKVEETLTSFDEQVVEKIDTIKSSIEEIDEKFSQLKEQEIPKYKGLIVETERKTESKLEAFNQKLDETLISFDEKLDETVSDVLEKINSVETISSSVEKEVTQKIEEVQSLQKRVNNELKNVEEKKEELSKKVTDLEVEIIRNESHIRSQNDYIESIQEEVRGVISKLNIEELEEQNYELGKKVKYLEEVFEKFNSETLTEGLLNEPPEIKNEDPLTPLDKNFVTLNQLQEHYRLFINRIQQQLSTLSGGGETRLKYLDDIVGIATNASAYDNKYLKYNHSIGKFEFVTVSGGSGGGESYWVPGVVGIVTTSNVGIATNNPTSTLTVAGDIEAINANFTGSIDQLSSPVVNIPSEIDATSRNYGILGVGTTIGFLDTGILAQFSGDSDQYCQVIVQNHNAGTEASADFIVNNSQELGLNHYVDLGINSPNYVGVDDLSDPNGGYVYNTGGTLTVGTADPFDLKFVYESFEVARVSQNGIGIGTTVVTSALTLSGDALIVGIVTATDFNSASDIKLKENVSVIDNPLDKIVKLEGVNFQWKETGKKSLGVIAQEVEKVLPELVSGEESKTVNYNGIIGLLIECVKEQQKEIEELKKLIDK